MDGTIRLYNVSDYAHKLDHLRVALSKPGHYVFKDISSVLDRIEAEVRDVVAIHHRDDITYNRSNPIVLLVEVAGRK